MQGVRLPKPLAANSVLFLANILLFLTGSVVLISKNTGKPHLPTEGEHRQPARDRVLLSPATPACGVFNYKEQDPTPFDLMWNAPQIGAGKGYHFADLQVRLDSAGQPAQITLPESCARSLQGQQGTPEPVFSSYGNNYTYEVVADKEVSEPQCHTLRGTWFLVSDWKHRKHTNLFDHLSTEWYHTWLAKMALLGSPKADVFITHLGGLQGGLSPAFPAVYSLLGEYVDWQHVTAFAAGSGGSSGSSTGAGDAVDPAPCVRFERAVTAASGWLWMATPLASYQSAPLQAFVDQLVAAVGAAEVRPDPCGPRAVVAARGSKAWKARFVLNEGEFLGTIRDALAGYSVHSVDLGELPFGEAVKEVRRASVFVFPHGGAGPNLLWLHRGAVVLELFPHMTADPMYRNLAVLTGKTYLSWQAQSFGDSRAATFGKGQYTPRLYHFTKASAFVVQGEELASVLKSAAMVVRGNLGANWCPANAGRFTYNLTLWAWASKDTVDCSLP